MLSKEEIICKATEEFGEQIGEIKIEENKVLFTENKSCELFTSEFEDLFDEDVDIYYNEGCLDTICVELLQPTDIDDAFLKIMKKYEECESLISLTKEKEKIVIIVERYMGWGKSTVIDAIGNEYHIIEGENSNGDWEVTISLEDEFDICNATPSEIRDRLRGHFDVITVNSQVNDTIIIIFGCHYDRLRVRERLNLTSSINECCYDLNGGKQLFVLNKAQIRDAKK